MSKKYVEFIKWTKDNNWNVIDKTGHSLMLKDEILSRYKEIPNEYLEFLKIVKQLISPNEKTWFICENEYNNEFDIAFRWNEFEALSLEIAKDDAEWKMEIISWWDNHLPIVMSVDGVYSFYAIDLYNEKGSIVKGYEPEFEETEKVANNIEEFFDLIMLNEIDIQ
ncbi:SMI1/KNR4 family protein [Clostridium saccharobutylicum]|uniref:SMI1 / KNR4 family protein n=1 Tax=Clostridium saccharobutylicum TaxID=169679 RepID=A0A1S8MQ41_CLOSA|nr:SMI1/KNR4 family protein [Clostridium saccharobutylicum]OOM06316.1 SMI1 / KNR4 family protein [Clostridium saccharobutylicum]